MKPQFIDTHCHVHFAAYKEDADAVTRRALDAGVGLITVGTQSTTSANAILHAEKFSNVWAAIGLHPNHLHKMHIDEDELPGFLTRAETFDADQYRELAKNPKVVAFGETGFDAFRLPEGFTLAEVMAAQEKNFRAHLDICHELNKPIIIHCRDAHEITTRILEEYLAAGKLERRGVLHCFTGTAAEAARYTALGFYVSLSGIVAFPPRKGQIENPLREVVRTMPHKLLLIETDAPYLSPPPHRGERNEPLYVKFVADVIAEEWQTSAIEVGEQTTANAAKLFGLNFYSH